MNDEILPLTSLNVEQAENTELLGQVETGLEDREAELSSEWVLQNIQKLSRMMGVSFEGIEDQVCSFLFEIFRRMMLKKKEGANEEAGKKKQRGGAPRELKRLEFSINYDGRRNEGKVKEVNPNIKV